MAVVGSVRCHASRLRPKTFDRSNSSESKANCQPWSPPAPIARLRDDASTIGVRRSDGVGVELPRGSGRGADDELAATGRDGDPCRPVERRPGAVAIVGATGPGAAIDRDLRRERETGAEQQPGSRRREHAARHAEACAAEDEAQPDRDERQRPQTKDVDDDRRSHVGKVDDHEDAAQGDQEDPPVQEIGG